MRHTLDPKLDVVFKMLFADARNKHILLAFINAVLNPQTQFIDVEVLNPDVPKEVPANKGAILDVLAVTNDGRQVNIEMQAAPYHGLWQRALYYWARAYMAQLQRGEEHVGLSPTESIFVLSFDALETDRYYSIFQLLEVHEHSQLTADLAIHILELGKVPPRRPHADDPSVLKWAKFFAATTDEELEEVAMSDPAINQAKEALADLSADPVAQRLAEDRRIAAWNYERTIRLEREAARAEGEAKATADAIILLCAALDIELTEERKSRVDSSSFTELIHLRDAIARDRAWPDA
jgi:predicted transposase/invertase (TIGR01784 family)